MSTLQLDVEITAPQPQPAQGLLNAEPGLYVNHENPAIYHLVTMVSAVNPSAKRMILTFNRDPHDPEKIVLTSSQLNYFGRPAQPGSMVKVTVQGSAE